ncbi:MAG: hypothetical protein RLY93_20635 [Sumerlaeia bacterium]
MTTPIANHPTPPETAGYVQATVVARRRQDPSAATVALCWTGVVALAFLQPVFLVMAFTIVLLPAAIPLSLISFLATKALVRRALRGEEVSVVCPFCNTGHVAFLRDGQASDVAKCKCGGRVIVGREGAQGRR